MLTIIYLILLSTIYICRDEVDQELQGTGIPEAVKRDRENICTEYESIALPFMQKHTDVFE